MKAGKKEGKGARGNLDGFSKKKAKFSLMSMHQSEILYTVTRNLYQNVAAMQKSASIANFGQN